MKNLSSFNKNVLTLVTGTGIAQAIPIAISPILTRLYTPSDFGVFSIYLSLSAILGSLVTGKYELAILLPKKRSDAISIVQLSMLLTTVASFFLLIIFLIFGRKISILLGNESIKPWLFFVPLSTFLSGIYQSLNYWFNREKEFELLAKNRITQTGSSAAINLGMGVLKSGTSGLVSANIAGMIAVLAQLGNKFKVKYFTLFQKHTSIAVIKKNAKRYFSFPKFDLAATLFNISAHNIVNIFFNVIYSSSIAGYFHLIQRIFGIPIDVIARSVQDVFKEEVARLSSSGKNTRKFYLRTLKKLFVLALIPSILILFLAKSAVIFFFGKEWAIAGEFATYLTPVFFLRFISFPLSFMVYIAEKQFLNTIIQFLLLIAIIFIFFYAKAENASTTVQYLAVAYSVFYMSYIIISYFLTTNKTSITNE